MTEINFADFQVQAKKRGVLGWDWGCFEYVHIQSHPERGDSRVKNRGWGWYSGQNEIPISHLGKMRPIWAICMKRGQKCPRTGKNKFNHLSGLGSVGTCWVHLFEKSVSNQRKEVVDQLARDVAQQVVQRQETHFWDLQVVKGHQLTLPLNQLPMSRTDGREAD